MSIIVERFKNLKANINNNVNIVAISKTFPMDHIKPLIDFGHCHFGENKVQEAIEKWVSIKKQKKNIKLHMVGKLQTNKAKKAVEIFDYIHSLDNKKLGEILSEHESKTGNKLKYFIQVNVGLEKQKSGIMPKDIDQFYNYCSNDLKLNVIGLMAIPPNNQDPERYFKYLNEANLSLGLKDLSIGMSSDYDKALKYKPTYIRLGSSIFGQRN